MAPGPEPAPLTRWQNTWRTVLVVVVGIAAFAATWATATDLSASQYVHVVVEVLMLPVSAYVVHHRRTRPVLIALVLVVLSGVFATASGAALLAVFSLAARRHLQGLLLVLPVSVVASIFFNRIVLPPPPGQAPHFVGEIISTTVISLLFVAVAYAIGARRATRQALLERAAAAEGEQQARIREAQTAERTRIAREMHDVLAHRISLVAMHASALNYRDDLSDDERRTAAATIERNAREALTDLREVLGVLRDPAAVGGVDATGELQPEAPQPSLRDLTALVTEAQTLGASITLRDDSGDVSERVGRAAYRIVQEALTNARKHAPGAPVSVQLRGGSGADLVVTISQPLLANPAGALPGSGLGLVGLRERVALAGGALEAGPDGAGHWVVTARLPLNA